MQPTRRRLAAAVALLALAGCGSSHDRRAGPPPPRLPRSLAQDFARRADEIARRLDSGDDCGALTAANALQQRSIALIGRVPPEYQETLQGTVNDLVDRIHCVPEATTVVVTVETAPPAKKHKPPGHAKGHGGKGHGKHKGHKEKDD